MDVIDDGNRHKLVENDIEVHCYHEDRKIHLNIHTPRKSIKSSNSDEVKLQISSGES